MTIHHKIVQWSDEDGCFLGMCPELMFGGVHGQDEAKVYAELCQAVEDVIEILETDGQPLPSPLAGKQFSLVGGSSFGLSPPFTSGWC